MSRRRRRNWATRIDRLAGAAGFEPAQGGIKSRGLTAWRRPNGRCDARSIARRRLMQGGVGSEARDPTVRVRRAAALDVDELALQHFGNLPGTAGADREAGFAARYLADRGDHRGGAAGEAFGQLAAFRIALPLRSEERRVG